MSTFTVDHTRCDQLGQTVRDDVGDIGQMGAQPCLSATGGARAARKCLGRGLRPRPCEEYLEWRYEITLWLGFRRG
jgi:hypothetical protein